jgi:glutamate formiminotransferase/formiminotetrahydrofolate cyclodeaminase
MHYLLFNKNFNFANNLIMKQIIECVPNFSEGRDMNIIQQICNAIESVDGIKLLDVDPGKATNRTVITFVGEPEAVVLSAFQAIKKASELIDMRKHFGEHPRMGATDVCPFIPIANITLDECVIWSKKLAKKVADELNIPTYLYEAAAQKPDRKNLATIRSGEYEGLSKKIELQEWKPDFGEAKFNAKSGATVIGARNFLVAFNVNLNTTSVRRANSIAFDVREQGRVLTDSKGKKIIDENGEPKRQEGTCKSVKAIGWFIEEYGIAQVSMNLTDISITPVHIAFDECVKSAFQRGMRVTGSELIGLIPLQAMLDAGKYFLEKQKRSIGVSEPELIKIAVKSMGLDDLQKFDPEKKIIEYVMRDKSKQRLVDMTLQAFADETASESMAPGGGSISAYVGALGISLATMVANLSSHKQGWDNQWNEFSQWAAKGEKIKQDLIRLVDEDTAAFNAIIHAFGLPKSNETEQLFRTKAIQDATLQAIEIPFNVMKKTWESVAVIKAMVLYGNPNSITDAGVGILCARAAMYGAYMNVKINTQSLKDKNLAQVFINEGNDMMKEIEKEEKEILELINSKI